MMEDPPARSENGAPAGADPDREIDRVRRRRVLQLLALTAGAATTVTAVLTRGFADAPAAGWPLDTTTIAVTAGVLAIAAAALLARNDFLAPGNELLVADVAVTVARLAAICVLALLTVRVLAGLDAPGWATGLPALTVAAIVFTPAVVAVVPRLPRH